MGIGPSEMCAWRTELLQWTFLTKKDLQQPSFKYLVWPTKKISLCFVLRCIFVKISFYVLSEQTFPSSVIAEIQSDESLIILLTLLTFLVHAEFINSILCAVKCHF